MRSVCLVVLSLLSVPLYGQSYSLVSPDMVQKLADARDSPAAQFVLRGAADDLPGPPKPMARVHTEGTLPGQGIRDESIAAERDFGRMQDLAFAYRLSGDKRYLAKVAELLGAWVAVYKVSGNPIDETPWTQVFMAFDLTHADLPPELVSKTTALFQSFATFYLDWLDANFAKDPYNWSSHRVKLAVLGAYEAGDSDLITRAHAAYSRQVKQNVRADGSVNDYFKRDALHYVTYDLEPLTVAAMAAKVHDEDWFHTAATGAPSVEQAVDWLIPFALGEKTHMEFAHSDVPFDAARAKAGEKGYSGQWEPGNSVTLFAECGYMDKRYIATLGKVVANTKGRVQPWILLLLAAAK